jgi:hypothetical protein
MVSSLAEIEQEDTPHSAALTLLADPHIWFLLLSHDDAAKRHAAASELAKLTPFPVDFAPDGDAAARETQLAALAEQLTSNRLLPAAD